ncbi:MAG: dCTP deaminase [Thermoproteales archaeon]|nr:dCTP deaminase [Thermoproteales archaeon]
MILGRYEILKLVKEKRLIENFFEKSLQQAGYDLRIKTAYRIKGEPYLKGEERILPNIEEITEDPIIIYPNEYLLMETMEKVNMPLDLAAIVFPRTTLFRMGLGLRNGVIDPGYVGSLVFGLKNESSLTVKIKKKSRVAQIIFLKVQGKTIPYEGVYKGGKITL